MLKRKKQPKVVYRKEDFVTAKDFKKRFGFWMSLFVAALLVVTAALLVNYLVFIPWDTDTEGFSWTTETIFAFAVVIFLLVMAVLYTTLYFYFTLKLKYNDPEQKKAAVATTGFVGGFLDTIGVGSFGVVTGLLKATRAIKDDSKLPGTLNAALGVAALIESALFVSSIQVDPATLLILLAILIVGTFFGTFFVSKIKNPQIVKIVMGITLFIVGILMILTHPQVAVIQTTNIGSETSLMDKPWRIIVASIIFFFLGAIQSFGVGLYAPSMAVLSFLGLRQDVVFPIMACGSALCMLPGGYNFIKRRNYLQLTTNLIMIASIFGVIGSFLLVFVGLKMGAGMDDWTFNAVLRWLAVVVIFYVSISMLVEYGLGEKKRKQGTKKGTTK